jgi:hypothetical protein
MAAVCEALEISKVEMEERRQRITGARLKRLAGGMP